MKRLTRNLKDNSTDAFILALETINRPTVSYKMEAFCILYCNALELLMKAKLLESTSRIFHKKKRGQPRKSLSFDECIGRLFTNVDDPVRKNAEFVSELRNSATHLVVPFVPPDIMGLFQAAVLNYAKLLGDWFGSNLSSRTPLGMMSIVYDFDPAQHSLDYAQIHRKLPAETIRWVKQFQDRIRAEAGRLGAASTSYFIPIEYKLALVKNPKQADIVISPGAAGAPAKLIEVPKNPDATHPHRQKEIVAEFNRRNGGKITINQYDFQCVKRVHRLSEVPQLYYKSKFAAPQYAPACVDWLLKEYQGNPSFFI